MFEITGALTSARALVQMAQDALNSRDDAKVRAALIDLQAKLFDATSAALSMAEKATALQASLSEAEREQARIKAKLEERSSYALRDLGGACYAYASKPTPEREDQVPHYLCQPCYDKGIKAVLRKETGLNGPVWVCPEGGTPHELVDRPV